MHFYFLGRYTRMALLLALFLAPGCAFMADGADKDATTVIGEDADGASSGDATASDTGNTGKQDTSAQDGIAQDTSAQDAGAQDART